MVACAWADCTQACEDRAALYTHVREMHAPASRAIGVVLSEDPSKTPSAAMIAASVARWQADALAFRNDDNTPLTLVCAFVLVEVLGVFPRCFSPF